MVPEVVTLPQNQPYGRALLDWLLARKDELPGFLVVVPTAQGSRRVRLGLAERGALLAPRVVTTGVLWQTLGAAPEAVEVLAWSEVLEGIEDWGDYAAIFPESPESGGPGWSLGLARAFAELRRTLQEAGLLIREAARRIPELDRERWEQLAGLESQVEDSLRDWGYQSRSSRLAEGTLELPEGLSRVVVAGVLDLPPVVTRFLEEGPLPVTVLVPDERVDSWGRPEAVWGEREIVWPDRGGVFLTGDPAQQAGLAVTKVSEGGGESEETGIATGDEEVAPELVRSFARAGWVIHDPGAAVPSPLAGWLGAWRSFLERPGVREAIDLLAFDQGRSLVKGLRYRQVQALSALRDSHLVRHLGDVQRARQLIGEEQEKAEQESAKKRLAAQEESAETAEAAMEALVALRRDFLQRGFHRGLRRLLGRIDPDGELGLEVWLEETENAARAVKRSPGFWLDLLRQDLGPVPEEVPDGRILDVQGWLELLHDPARHLVICGMNEGRVPGRSGTNPWLPESARQALGLPCEKSRAARDAYLLHALLEMRRESGRVDLIVGKISASGEVLLPSRLLLTAKGDRLAHQVAQLFAEVAPVDSGVAWHLEDRWKWRPRLVEPKARLSVTAFSKYLACPFRYYLQRVLGMNRPEPERAEWNARDFGSILHRVLEEWGRDERVRDSADPEEIRTFLLASLDERVRRHFGTELPLAVSLQVESMRLRLGWFAERQAETRAEGWRVVEVEKSLTLEIEGTTVTGEIDRIERHEDGRVRVLDYKTSKEAKDVKKEHLQRFRDDPPEHLQAGEVRGPGGEIWKNLQVPFYAAAFGRVDEIGYFALGQDEPNVRIVPWEGFGEEEKESAMRCAAWIVARVRAGKFWPPAEKVTYDDIEDLTYGRDLPESFVPEGGAA